jgi:putative aldo/keto reductase
MNVPKVKLNNGVLMPIEGFGVFQIPDAAQCLEAVRCALKTGYRLIDTASVYDNEVAVGKAINEFGINRSEIFLTTKVWTSQMGYDRTMKAFENSLKRLGQDYLDLYLIHMPYGDVAGTWRAMERLYHEGRIRSIGVCNFSEAHLTDLCLSSEVKPMVNQVECHPFTQQIGMLALCRENDIQLEAWAPFAEGKNEIFSNPLLSDIAHSYGKTVGQIILRWNIQRGVVVIPKSVRPERIVENSEIFDFSLSENDMSVIAGLDTGKQLIFDYNKVDEVKRIYAIPCPE